MKVLVLDDDPVVLEVTAAVLESLGHEVLTRERALGSTQVLITEQPEVALVDIEMPGLSGDELIRLVRENSLLPEEHPTAFVLYSGRGAEELERLVAETGALGAIRKSANPAEFAGAFTRMIEKL